jgi:hypothetical protein
MERLPRAIPSPNAMKACLLSIEIPLFRILDISVQEEEDKFESPDAEHNHGVRDVSIWPAEELLNGCYFSLPHRPSDSAD